MLENLFDKYKKNLTPTKEEKEKTWNKIEGGLGKKKNSFYKFVFKWRFALSIVLVLFVFSITFFRMNSYYSIKDEVVTQDAEIVEEDAMFSKEAPSDIEAGGSELEAIEPSEEEKSEEGIMTQENVEVDLWVRIVVGGLMIGFGIFSIIFYIKKYKKI